MEVVSSVLHMNGGSGETSYAHNSLLQRKVISMTRPIMEEAVIALYHSTASSHKSTFVIADLGCSSGPNALFAISGVIETLEDIIQKNRMFNHDIDAPEYQVYLNDLPGNDFNALFRSLPMKRDHNKKLCSCFFSGVPETFYDRLFPSKSLHFVHSSYSLHWLSKVPEGLESSKWNIIMSRSSLQSVIDAYYRQFQDGFSVFLKHRGQEIAPGGRMLLTLLGRRSEDPSSEEFCSIWELLAVALNEMVFDGLIKEDKLHTFNLPLYTPSSSEVKAEVLKEGSFSISRLEVWEVNWSGFDKTMEKNSGGLEEGYSVARCMRAAFEPILISHFGEEIIEDVFRRYRLLIVDRMVKEKTGFVNVSVSLSRRQT